MNYVIYLYTNEGAGFYTGVYNSTSGPEVTVHRDIRRAKVFESKSVAFQEARILKNNFPCIIRYELKSR